MKAITHTVSFAFLMASCTQPRAPMQSSQAHGAKGGSVWVITNTVRPQARALYERFMTEVFFHALATSTVDSTKNKFLYSRYLRPERQNDDSTWTYAFILDPHQPNGDYTVLNVLKERYGEQKAIEYNEIFTSCLKEQPVIYKLVHSGY